MLPFYFDDDTVNSNLVRAARKHGLKVIIPADCGMVGADDDVHLKYAADHSLVLLTDNRQDFSRIHNEWLIIGREHSGIALSFQMRFSVGEKLRRILNIASAHTADEMKNNLVYISNW